MDVMAGVMLADGSAAQGRDRPRRPQPFLRRLQASCGAHLAGCVRGARRGPRALRRPRRDPHGQRQGLQRPLRTAPSEVMFDRICREQGISHRLAGVRSPTTTGKIERYHQSLRREFLDGRVFDSCGGCPARTRRVGPGYNSVPTRRWRARPRPGFRLSPLAEEPGQHARGRRPRSTAGSGSCAASPQTAWSRSTTSCSR